MEIYFSPDQVGEYVPGLNENLLAQMRFRGDGPVYIQASPRKIVYARSELDRYLATKQRQATGDVQDGGVA